MMHVHIEGHKFVQYTGCRIFFKMHSSTFGVIYFASLGIKK